MKPEIPGLVPDIRRDYPVVRRAQEALARVVAKPEYRDGALPTRNGSVPIRIFEPDETSNDRVILFLHGGGWVIGSAESYSRVCWAMAEATGSTLWSVDYRLAPEHPFPAPLDDCFDALRAAVLGPGLVGASSASNLVVMGDSAGANLAAVSSLLLRDEDLPMPGAQILLYPVTQSDHNPETSEFDSVREHQNRWFPRAVDVEGFVELYAGEHDDDWRVAPLNAPDLTNQPRTLVITASWDPLRDEGEAYGRALAEAGNEVRIERIDRALHGFLSMPRFARPVATTHALIDDFLTSPDGGQA